MMGIMWIFLIMGNAGFISSAVSKEINGRLAILTGRTLRVQTPTRGLIATSRIMFDGCGKRLVFREWV